MITLSRRRVLGLGAAAVGVLAIAGPTVGQLGSYPPLTVDTAVLTPKTAAILGVLGDWLLPPGGPLPGSGGTMDSLLLIDDFLAGMPSHHRRLMLALPLAFEHGTALDRYGARRLTAMSADQQQDYLDRWFFSEDVVRAQLVTALKMLWNTTYLDRVDVQQVMGIPAQCGVTA